MTTIPNGAFHGTIRQIEHYQVGENKSIYCDGSIHNGYLNY